MTTERNYPCERYVNRRLGEEYRKYSHPSGLDIYIFPKKMSSTYAIFGTRYGSIHNVFKRDGSDEWLTVPDGIAHFLEHKLFACEDGSDAFERFSEYGADANAYTSFNKTCYLFSCTDRFEESLCELLTFVTHPYFTEDSVASEVGIIAEEIRMYDDNPHDRCFYGLMEGLYEGHSICRNICGSAESISEITPELLYACYDSFYRLSNMALVICGDVEDSVCLAIADKCLFHIKEERKQTVCANENEKEGPASHKKYVEQKMQVSKPLFKIGFKDTDIPKDGNERQRKDVAMSILDEMLFSDSGRLYASLIEKDLISPNLSCGYSISESFAYNSISGSADDPQAVLDEILDFIKEEGEKGLSKEDFLRCKRVLYADAVRSFDSTDSIANNLFAFICEDSELLAYTDVIESVTFEYVQELFTNAFDTDRMTLSVILPNDTSK